MGIQLVLKVEALGMRVVVEALEMEVIRVVQQQAQKAQWSGFVRWELLIMIMLMTSPPTAVAMSM
jgi:hypothetical protein